MAAMEYPLHMRKVQRIRDMPRVAEVFLVGCGIEWSKIAGIKKFLH